MRSTPPAIYCRHVVARRRITAHGAVPTQLRRLAQPPGQIISGARRRREFRQEARE